ncbi:MAG: riboflavin synthase [Firmicutes bacterium]|nr:riboflavin synthase [Bacillota bacterium]
MFTGIVEEIGTLRSVNSTGDSAILTISAKKVLEDVHLGDSIAVNGVCLTVTSFSSDKFTADVMHETLNRSSLGALRTGSRVNLERAMPADGRFGGHIVAGHIDGTGTVSAIKKDSNAIWYTIRTKPEILKYIIEKGSIAIDGISLTVAKLDSVSFSVSIIPHTVQHTNLSERKMGDTVNLENDCVGKYVEKLLMPNKPSSGITADFLSKHGFY